MLFGLMFNYTEVLLTFHWRIHSGNFCLGLEIVSVVMARSWRWGLEIIRAKYRSGAKLVLVDLVRDQEYNMDTTRAKEKYSADITKQCE